MSQSLQGLLMQYVENVKGIKITETIIEDCPNNDDVSYETWIDDVKGTI